MPSIGPGVFKPPLLCSGVRSNGPDFVSKLLNEEEADLEFSKSSLVRLLDPDERWSITPLRMCDLAEKQTNKNYVNPTGANKLLISKYGGVGLLSLLKKSWSKLPLFIKVVKSIIPGLDILNKEYLHGDLHFNNIVWDGLTGRLIDFGELRRIDEVMDEEWLGPRDTLIYTITGDKSVQDTIFSLGERGRVLADPFLREYVSSGDLRRIFDLLQGLFDDAGCRRAHKRRYDKFSTFYAERRLRPRSRGDYISIIMSLPE